MKTFKIGYMVGSLATESINRKLANALFKLAPPELQFTEIPFGHLPLYSYDYDSNYPQDALDLKKAIRDSDGLLIITPEYNRSIPGGLKNAIDWASRPWGQNAFAHTPTGVIGASPGSIGTAVGQQHLRSILGFLNAPQMNWPEAYIQFTPDFLNDKGEVADESTKKFLRQYLDEFHTFVKRVTTVLPREG